MQLKELEFNYAISAGSGIFIDDAVFSGTPDTVCALNAADGEIL